MQRTYHFAGFELDTAARELRKAGQRVSFSSLSLALLGYLIQHRNRVVDADELRHEVWRGVKVSDGSLRQAIWELRQALGDSAQTQRIVRTVRGQGYRFIADLDEAEHGLTSSAAVPCVGPAPGELVGRGPELQALREALSKALHVSGRAFVVVGGAGVGKSRLVQELRDTAGVPFVEARGEPDGCAPPLGVWRSIVRAYSDAVAEPARTRLACDVATALGDDEPSFSTHSAASKAPRESRSRLFASLSSSIVELACAKPGIILVEDAHWLDEDSLLFLAQLAAILPKTRTLLLLTLRAPTEARKHVLHALRTLQCSPDNQQLQLDPLPKEHVGQLLAPVLQAPHSCELAAEIHEAACGNPRLALDLGRILASSAEPRDLLRGCSERLYPALRRRMDALGKAARAAVGAASVWGRAFTLAELCAVLDEGAEQALVRLEPLLQEGVLTTTGPVSFRFAHPLYEKTAYADLTRAERARLHRTAFEWLHGQGGDAKLSQLDELTRHAGEAAAVGLARPAVEYSVRSAEQAYERAQPRSALLHTERALSFLELAPDHTAKERLTLTLMRARMVRACEADTPTVNQLFLTVAERAELLGEHTLFAEAVLGYTGHHVGAFSPSLTAIHVDHMAMGLVERALAALPEEPTPLRTLLRCSLLYLLVPSTDRTRRDRLADATLTEARLSGEPSLLARVLSTCIYACAAPDQLQSRIAHCNELVALARTPQLSHLLVDALSTRALCFMSDLQVKPAVRDAQEAQERAATHPSRYTRARSRLLDLTDAFCRGDLESAEKLSRASFDAAPQDLAVRALFTVRMASVSMLRDGLGAELIAFHERILLAYPDAVSFRCNLAGSYALQGQFDQAARHFDFVAEDDFRRMSQNLNTLSELTLLVGAAVEMGCAARAQRLYERLLPHAHSLVFFAGEACPAGVVAMYLADLAVTMRRFEAAEHWLRIADRLHERLGAEMFHAFSQIVRARFLSATRPEQPELARRLLRGVSAFGRARNVRWLCTASAHAAERLAGARASAADVAHAIS